MLVAIVPLTEDCVRRKQTGGEDVTDVLYVGAAPSTFRFPFTLSPGELRLPQTPFFCYEDISEKGLQQESIFLL